MKLLIDGEYKNIGVMSFLKCVIISQIILFAIILSVNTVLLIILNS